MDEWVNDDNWLLEIIDEHDDEIDFHDVSGDGLTLDEAISLAIRLGGNLRKMGVHRPALLADAAPGYWLETRRMFFNLTPLALNVKPDADSA